MLSAYRTEDLKAEIERREQKARENPELARFADTDLLRELLLRGIVSHGKLFPAPTRVQRAPECRSLLISTGKNETAEITIWPDGLKELEIEL